MTYHITEEEYEAVLKTSSQIRFEHFVKKVADWEQVWSVRNDEGWLVPVAPEGFEYFPLWPHPSYAQRVSDDNFPGHTAIEITFDELLDDWIPRLEQDDVKIAVFPDTVWDFW
ncbi:MAG: DUF2750 domain-containing protein, partial [Pseudomonadales bacterium]|nr:DUF2750 domain-containing protein [Pseudomonadales bacterium]